MTRTERKVTLSERRANVWLRGVKPEVHTGAIRGFVSFGGSSPGHAASRVPGGRCSALSGVGFSTERAH